MTTHRASNGANWLREKLAEQSDYEEITLGASSQIQLQYLKSVTNSNLVYQYVVVPSYEMDDVGAYEAYIATFPGTGKADDQQKLIEGILEGYTLVSIGPNSYLFNSVKVESGGVGEAINEAIVQGPREAFSESIETNLNLIRRRYQTSELKVETMTLGSLSRTAIAIVYDQKRVDSSVLQQVKDRLKKVKIDILQSAGELEKYISPHRFRIFPNMVVTERPDRVVLNLTEGKVAILMDTTGFAIIAPAVFTDFFSAMDDKIQIPLVSQFLKLIRYVGLFITLTLPGLYVTFASYNPEILKSQLVLLIAGSRAAVPYPSFMEVFFMLLMMEFLTEASLRLPKAIGPTATTVGGLILGQAATQAGLVSNIMIILVSAVAISNFVIPLSMMGYTIRVIKYIIVLTAMLFGIVGIMISVVGIIMYLSDVRSFGKPYFRLTLWESKEKVGHQHGKS